MLIAGEDTTAFTLAWAVHELCESPRWASELRVEADAVVGPMDAPADLETANRLARANAVANETMRLRPVAPIAGLEANVDTTLGDIFVPKGTRVTVLLRPAASIRRISSIRSRSGPSGGSRASMARITPGRSFRSARDRACAPAGRSLSSK